MRKTGIGTIELAEKLGERMNGVEIDKRGIIQTGNGITVNHDERRGIYQVRATIGEQTLTLEVADMNQAFGFVLGAL
jgi:hypothetical protein